MAEYWNTFQHLMNPLCTTWRLEFLPYALLIFDCGVFLLSHGRVWEKENVCSHEGKGSWSVLAWLLAIDVGNVV